MQVRTTTTLVYGFAFPTQVIGKIEAARSSDQTVLSEALSAMPPTELACDTGPDGGRSFRACLSGEVTISYDAVVDNGTRALLPSAARQHLWSELPADVLPLSASKPLLPQRPVPALRIARVRSGGGRGRSGHVDYGMD